jgi:DNA polymerase III delta prime subunit
MKNMSLCDDCIELNEVACRKCKEKMLKDLSNCELIKFYNDKSILVKDVMLGNNSDINIKALQNEIIMIKSRMREIAENEGLNLYEYYQKYTFDGGIIDD